MTFEMLLCTCQRIVLHTSSLWKTCFIAFYADSYWLLIRLNAKNQGIFHSEEQQRYAKTIIYKDLYTKGPSLRFGGRMSSYPAIPGGLLIHSREDLV